MPSTGIFYRSKSCKSTVYKIKLSNFASSSIHMYIKGCNRCSAPSTLLKSITMEYLVQIKYLQVKPASHCPTLKSLMALVLTNVIGCDSCLLRSNPIFRSHCPTDRIRFLLCISHNAFRAVIEMNNRMRSIQLSLTCQNPSNTIRFFKIASDCVLPLPDFLSDFPSDPSNH